MKWQMMVLALAWSTGCALTADDIVTKSLAARGGVDKLKAVQTVRMSGNISLGENGSGPLQVEMKRPGKMREQLTLNGKLIIRTTTGATGWSLVQADDKSVPRPLTAGELRNTAGGADFDGPLVDYKAKGNKVELVGKAEVAGKSAYHLKVTLKDGQVRQDYVDAESFLETKWEGKLLNDGKEFGVQSIFHDYRAVVGVQFAFAIDSGDPGSTSNQKLVFEKVEVNVPEDDSRFGKPTLEAGAQ